MRLGIFGGTFDPVHFGHLLLAEQCREQCRLDQVWFIPAGSPPHKQQAPITPAGHRVEMLKLALAGHPAFQINEMELQREGRTYTYETLTKLHEERPKDELFFLIGADSLDDLPTWRKPERIVELATVVAANRGECPLADEDELQSRLGPDIARRVQLVTMPGIDLSATDIRYRVRSGKSIRFMLPRAVEIYIQQHGLYVR